MSPLLIALIVVCAVALLAFVAVKLIKSKEANTDDGSPTLLALSSPAEGRAVLFQAAAPEHHNRKLFSKKEREANELDHKVEEAINRLILSN